MEVMFTPSARIQLLEHVAYLRGADRDRAARFVDALERRLEALADGSDDGRAVSLLDHGSDPTDAVRLGWWIRADVLWILALYPGPAPIPAR
jgi:hypothetical protein